MNILDTARIYRKIILEAISKVDDKTASEAPALSPNLKGNGELVAAGTRINWNGQLKRAVVDLWDTEDNNPDNAAVLWEDIEYREGYRIIPNIITVSSAFALDEIGWWQDSKYKSKLASNVYTPDQYPAGWEKL
jgi:hypothetical protein